MVNITHGVMVVSFHMQKGHNSPTPDSVKIPLMGVHVKLDFPNFFEGFIINLLYLTST